jgi:hypothetical protein
MLVAQGVAPAHEIDPRNFSLETFSTNRDLFHLSCERHCIRAFLGLEAGLEVCEDFFDQSRSDITDVVQQAVQAVASSSDTSSNSTNLQKYKVHLANLLAVLIRNQSIIRLVSDEYPGVPLRVTIACLLPGTYKEVAWRLAYVQSSTHKYTPTRLSVASLEELQPVCHSFLSSITEDGSEHLLRTVTRDSQIEALALLKRLAEFRAVAACTQCASVLAWFLHAAPHFIVCFLAAFGVSWAAAGIAGLGALFSLVLAIVEWVSSSTERFAHLVELLETLDKTMKNLRRSFLSVTDEAVVDLMEEIGKISPPSYGLAKMLSCCCRSRRCKRSMSSTSEVLVREEPLKASGPDTASVKTMWNNASAFSSETLISLREPRSFCLCSYMYANLASLQFARIMPQRRTTQPLQLPVPPCPFRHHLLRSPSLPVALAHEPDPEDLHRLGDSSAHPPSNYGPPAGIQDRVGDLTSSSSPSLRLTPSRRRLSAFAREAFKRVEQAEAFK